MHWISAENLSKRFGSRRVFTDVNFRVATGEVLAIVGANGSGKSTMVLTLLGEYLPTKGSVTFGEDDTAMTEEGYRDGISLVSPYLNLYDGLTGEENLVFFASVSGFHVTGKEINALLARVGLEGRGDDPVRAYSSGMKQRLKYAVALLTSPRFLFLDEPTSNLDDAGKKIVYEIIEEQKQHAVVVLATNEAEDHRCASQFCRLDG